jgi:hypothetical protein
MSLAAGRVQRSDWFLVLVVDGVAIVLGIAGEFFAVLAHDITPEVKVGEVVWV